MARRNSPDKGLNTLLSGRVFSDNMNVSARRLAFLLEALDCVGAAALILFVTSRLVEKTMHGVK